VTSNPGSKLVTTLFHAWEKANINFVVLRNYKELPDCIGNDIDILVSNETLPFAEKILKTVSNKLGFKLHNRAEFSPVCLFVIHASTGYQIHFDLFTSLQWRFFDILIPDQVLRNRSMCEGIPIPHSLHEATLNLLTTLLYQGHIKDKYKSFIAQSYRENTEQAMVTLTRLFGDKIGKQIINSVTQEDWDSIEARRNDLRKALALNQLCTCPTLIFKKIFFDIKRLVKRWFNYPGVFIVCIGPDGSGKTSVADRVMKRLETTFKADKTHYYHWKPITFQRSKGDIGPVDNPHGKSTRCPLASTIYLFYHVFEFFFGGILRLKPVLFRNGMVVVDRYFYDIMVDPKRYRLNAPIWLVYFVAKIIVKPDIVICLDAPAKIFYERKQEVSFEEVVRQREAYLAFVKRLPNGHIVDASRPLDDAVRQTEDIIIKYMVERTARRFGFQEL
jgi:thymidylate kinase